MSTREKRNRSGPTAMSHFEIDGRKRISRQLFRIGVRRSRFVNAELQICAAQKSQRLRLPGAIGFLDSEVGSLRGRRAASKLELQLQPPLDRSWSAERKYAGAGSDTIGARIRHCVRSSAVDRTSTTIELRVQDAGSRVEVGKVKGVEDTDARNDRQPLVPSMPHPAEGCIEIL